MLSPKLTWNESESHSIVSDSLRVHGILQARTLEGVAFHFFRKSSQPRDRTQVSHIAGGFFTSWAEPPGKLTYITLKMYFQSSIISQIVLLELVLNIGNNYSHFL